MAPRVSQDVLGGLRTPLGASVGARLSTHDGEDFGREKFNGAGGGAERKAAEADLGEVLGTAGPAASGWCPELRASRHVGGLLP